MNILDKLHMIHRFWRYRLGSEKSSVKYLLNQNLAGTTMLDIGANKGIYTYWMSKKAGPKGKVIGFEPQPELGTFLMDIKKSFNLHNVTIENKGLSNTGDELVMYRKEIGAGGAYLQENDTDDPTPNDSLQKIKVKVTTLDEYFRNNPPGKLSFIKCDVEGHELPVFRGGQETLKNHMPVLLFECHHEQAQKGEIFSFLEHLGYSGFFIENNQRINYRHFEQYPYRKSDNHRNYIFIKA